MGKPILITDLDNTLRSTGEVICRFLEERHGIVVRLHEITGRPELMGTNTDLKPWMMREMFADRDFWFSTKLFAFAREVLDLLSKTFSIHVTTDQWTENGKRWAKEWLKERRVRHDKVIFTNAQGRFKHAQRVGAMIIIEDHPDAIQLFLQDGRKVIMRQRPWNEHLISDHSHNSHLTPFSTWSDLHDLLQGGLRL